MPPCFCLLINFDPILCAKVPRYDFLATTCQWPGLSPYSRRQIPFIQSSTWSSTVGLRWSKKTPKMHLRVVLKLVLDLSYLKLTDYSFLNDWNCDKWTLTKFHFNHFLFIPIWLAVLKFETFHKFSSALANNYNILGTKAFYHLNFGQLVAREPNSYCIFVLSK